MMITKKCKIFTFIATVGLLAAICYAQDPQTNANTRDIANLSSDVTGRLAKKVDKVHFSVYSSHRQVEINAKVSNVTASAPLASSGGATPNITLSGSIPFKNISTAGHVYDPAGAAAAVTTTSIGAVPTSRTVNGLALSSNITITTISGNAATATALASNGTNCSAGQAALGVDASGNSEGCFTPSGTYTLPTATSSVLGGVKPDGATIANTSGSISIAPSGSWTAVAFQNSWTNFGSPYESAGYYKDSYGHIHVKGIIKSGTAGTVAFTLPAGYIPAEYMFVPLMLSGGTLGYAQILTDGTVTIFGTLSGTLTSIRFSFKP